MGLVSSCRDCPFCIDSYDCAEGGAMLPSACRPGREMLSTGSREIVHSVPNWCPVLYATIRGGHVRGIRLRLRMVGGRRPCDFVYCAEGGHQLIQDWVDWGWLLYEPKFG